MEKYPAISVKFDRRKTASTIKLGTIEILVSWKGEKLYIPTGVRVHTEEWKNNKVIRRIDCIELNKRISEEYNSISSRIKELCDAGEFSFEAIKQVRVESKCDVLDWIESRIAVRPLRESTKKQHMVMLRSLRALGRIKAFSDLNVYNIKIWDDTIRGHLRTQSSVHGYHKRLKPYIFEAIQFGLMDNNPYNKIKIDCGRTDVVRYLTDDERNKIEDLKIDGTLANVRDCFIFACYTGLSYSDMAKFRWDDVVELDGDYYIIDKRLKTDSQYKIRILAPALAILERNGHILPVLSNQKSNMYLKVIASMAGITKNLTTHMARHTFATWALHSGVKIEIVSKMLAHSDIKTTQRYAKVLQEDVTAGFDFLEEKLKK